MNSEQCMNCGKDWDKLRERGMLQICPSCKTRSVCHYCGWCGVCDEIVLGYKTTPAGSKQIVNVGVLVDPTRPARLVFSFTMARGTEKSKESFDEYVDTVLRTVNDAVMKIGHGSDGRFEALIVGGEIVD